MKTNFQNEFANLLSKTYVFVGKLVDKKGGEGSHTSDKVLKIKDDNLMFNLSDSRYLVEISNNFLIDNEGYHYNHWHLEASDYFKLIDYLNKTYKGGYK